MPRRSSLEVAKADIEKFFDSSEKRIFTFSELGSVLRTERTTWHLAPTLTQSRFIGFLLQQSKLQELQVKSEGLGDATRYAWGTPSLFSLGLSLRKGAYLCHGSAVFLHGLTQDLPKTIYINVEQSPKPSFGGGMTQESINLAFSRPARMSRYTLRWGKLTFVVVSGKATGRLEVGRVQGPDGEPLEATKLERTLIDIAVRPAYAGGVFKVLEAYTSARDRVSVNTLVATLKKLGYVYPYHQAIGFLLERAGCAPERLEPLRKLEMRFDFYLSHGIKEKGYDLRWKLFFPKGM